MYYEGDVFYLKNFFVCLVSEYIYIYIYIYMDGQKIKEDYKWSNNMVDNLLISLN